METQEDTGENVEGKDMHFELKMVTDFVPSRQTQKPEQLLRL